MLQNLCETCTNCEIVFLILKNCAEKTLVRKFVPDVDQHPSFGVLFYLKSVCVRVYVK